MDERKFPSEFAEKTVPSQGDYTFVADSESSNRIKKIKLENLKGDKGDSIVWKGSYNGSTSYAVNDVVSYTDGKSYICKLATTGNIPTNTTYWDTILDYIPATSTNKGVVELATNAQVLAGTDTEAGNPLVVQPSQLTLVGGVPSGTVSMFSTNTAPTGWLLCDGSNISRTTYSGLFSVIGTTYGSGDGSTTFTLPNLKGRVVVGRDSGQTEFDTLGETGGEKSHTLTISEIPAHTHGVYGGTFQNPFGSGISYAGSGASVQSGSEGGGQAHNNLQPYIVLNYIIKA